MQENFNKDVENIKMETEKGGRKRRGQQRKRTECKAAGGRCKLRRSEPRGFQKDSRETLIGLCGSLGLIAESGFLLSLLSEV